MTEEAGAPGASNFAFLARYDPALLRIATLAERYFPDDPVTALIKLRQFGEVLAQQVAARAGVLASPEEPQADLLRRLQPEAGYPRELLDLFHDLRRAGNEAVHGHRGDHATALACLKLARQLAVWFLPWRGWRPCRKQRRRLLPPCRPRPPRRHSRRRRRSTSMRRLPGC